MKKFLCPIQVQAKKNSHQSAVISSELTLTYQALDEHIEAAVSFLKKLNVKKNERVGILSANDFAYIVLLWAFWRFKAVAVLLNVRLPMATLQQQMKSLGISTLFVDSRERVHTAIALKDVMSAITITSTRQRPLTDNKKRTISVYPQKQAGTIMYTSGTSDQPKAALHTLGNHFYSALGSNKNIPVGKNDRWLLSLPLYHVGGIGIIFRTFLAGAAVVIPQSSTDISQNVEKFRITHLSLVPTQLLRMLKEKGDRSSLKAILLGGSMLPVNLLQKAEKRRWPIYISYGLTEMSSQVATSSLKHQSSVIGHQIEAKILPYRKIKISKDREILVKGETLFQGYVQGKKIIRPTKNGGWFPTGDMGALQKGHLRVTGRRDNMFISGGENIQPEEIEKYLLRVRGIEAALVFARPDQTFGFRPAAYIKRRDKKITNAYIRSYLQKFLPSFKIPIHFYPWPKNLNMNDKHNRRTLIKKGSLKF